MSGDDETRDQEHLKLDQRSLEAIIEGVAAKLKEDCTRGKQGEHSGSLAASGSSKNSGEHLDSPNSARLFSPSTRGGVKFFHYREISKPMAERYLTPDQARHGTARHGRAWHGSAWQIMARLGMARHGSAWQGTAWQGTALHCNTTICKKQARVLTTRPLAARNARMGRRIGILRPIARAGPSI